MLQILVVDGKYRRYAIIPAFGMVILPQNPILVLGMGRFQGFCSCILSTCGLNSHVGTLHQVGDPLMMRTAAAGATHTVAYRISEYTFEVRTQYAGSHTRFLLL